MLRFTVLVAFGVASVLAMFDEECLELVRKSAKRCCKSPQHIPSDNPTHECRQAEEMGNCEYEKCIAEKRGILADDGTIDLKALKAKLAEIFEERPKLVKNAIKNCKSFIDVKNVCELKKLDFCLTLQIEMSCPDFYDEGDCSEIKELAERCGIEYHVRSS